MGMFDEVHYKGEVLQTKDFDCEMDYYWIEGGRLLKTFGYYEDIPVPGRLSCLPMLRRFVEEGRNDTNFHGMLRAGGRLFKFTDGNLVEEIKTT